MTTFLARWRRTEGKEEGGSFLLFLYKVIKFAPRMRVGEWWIPVFSLKAKKERFVDGEKNRNKLRSISNVVMMMKAVSKRSTNSNRKKQK